MTPMINVLGICGSLRRDSYNTATLRVAQALASAAGLSITIAEIGDLPLYNEDLRTEHFPAPVERLRAQIQAADALLFVTPEYNYSVPGVLKNAIDWASRPPEQPFAGKPVAMMGASPGVIGTGRAQYHLRQILVCVDALPLNKPEVMIGAAHERFDADGQLVHEPTREHMARQLAALASWTRRLART